MRRSSTDADAPGQPRPADPFRVALDARALVGGGGGLRRYTVELLRALTALPVDLSAWVAGWHLPALHETLAGELAQAGLRLPIQTTRAPGKLLYDQPGLALWTHWPAWAPVPRLLPRELDLFHALHWPLPTGQKVPLVLTIHDLIALRHPQWVPPNVLAVHRAIAALAPRAARVIVDSEATQAEVLALTRVKPERVTVVPLGVCVEAFAREVTAGELAQVRARYGLKKPFFLTVGSIEPRRNTAAVLAAYDRLSTRGDSDTELVVVGRRIGDYPAFDRALGRTRTSTVHCLEAVPQADLTALLQAATGCVCVSLAEGFGLPVLEAFAAGCPVVAATATSLPEVAGDAALLVDPEDPVAIAAALERLAGEPELRGQLSARGRPRAAQFTWERTARLTLEVYRQALG